MKFRHVVFLPLLFGSTILFAESTYERDLKQLIEQRDKALADAADAVNRRFDPSFEQLLRRATQANDLAAAVKIKEAVRSTAPLSGPPLAGKYVFHRDGFPPKERELAADGRVLRADGKPGKWVSDGTTLTITYPDGGGSVFKLPIHNGKLVGKAEDGDNITLEQKSR